MALKFHIDPGKTEKEAKEFTLQVLDRIIEAYIRAGEKFIQDCRSQPQSHAQGFYLDDTTNLRNSVQYFLFHNGELVEKSEVPFTDTDNVMDLVEKEGFTFIGLAGMNYASYVEAKGYNVLTMQKEALYINLENYFKEVQKFIDNG